MRTRLQDIIEREKHTARTQQSREDIDYLLSLVDAQSQLIDRKSENEFKMLAALRTAGEAFGFIADADFLGMTHKEIALYMRNKAKAAKAQL